jgi:hypothetical protein
MPTVAYIANQFPSLVEPYVADEIQELQGRGVGVIPCSVHRSDENLPGELKRLAAGTMYLRPLRLSTAIKATLLGWRRRALLIDLLKRMLWQGPEPAGRRLRALAHIWLGAYYAVLVEE